MSIQPHTLEEITPNYKVFLFDIWGVLHNGIHALPGAIEIVDSLQDQGKLVLAVSNSMRDSVFLSNHFKSMGIKIAPEFIFSSGDTCREYLNEHGGTIFQIGTDYGGDLLQGLDIEVVDSIEKAQSIILTTYIYDIENLGKYDDLLKQAVKRDLLALCPNPDIMAMHGDKYHYCPGAIAKRYEDMDGRTIYFGKPYKPIFESAYRHACDLIPGLQKSDVIMFGDTLETDIRGANEMGFDSALMLTGIVGKTLNLKDDAANLAGIIELDEFHKFPPNWILVGF